jgi:hypothetical protein
MAELSHRVVEFGQSLVVLLGIGQPRSETRRRHPFM